MSTSRSALGALTGWLDTRQARLVEGPDSERVYWWRCLPFIGLHVAALGIFLVGFSWVAALTAFGLYALRMFFITGFFHRYFSHRSFKTSRWFQFVMAVAGGTAAQRDAMWWSAHHRHHHVYSDEPEDPHSPRQVGFFRSHIGWFMTPKNFPTRGNYVRDWSEFPELRFLNRFDWLPAVCLAAAVFASGVALEHFAPQLGTNGLQMLIWGFALSTVVLANLTYCVNSVSHVWGRRRYKTADDSRNNLFVALATLGEGWHNNHHHYQGSARQGFRWWEIDITYYGLVVLSWLGLIWDLRPVPKQAQNRNLA